MPLSRQSFIVMGHHQLPCHDEYKPFSSKLIAHAKTQAIEVTTRLECSAEGTLYVTAVNLTGMFSSSICLLRLRMGEGLGLNVRTQSTYSSKIYSG